MASPQNLVESEIKTQYLAPARVHNYLIKVDPQNSNLFAAAEIHEIYYASTIPLSAIKILNYDKKK